MELTSFAKGTINDVVKTLASKESIKKLYKVSLYRNAGYLMLNSIIGAVLGFIFWILAARFYSISEVGFASALIAAMGLINSSSLLGFNIGLVRFLPDEQDKKGMINSCFTTICICSIVMAIVFVLGTPFWSPALSFLVKDFKFLLTFVVFTTVISLFMLQGRIFVALRSAKFTFVQQTIMQVLKISLVMVFASIGTWGILFSWGIAALVALTIGNLSLLRKISPGYFPQLIIKKKVINEMTHYSLGNYIAEVIGSLPVYILPLMIVNILGPESSAYFRIAYGVASVLFMILMAMILSLFAESSAEPEKLRVNTIKTIKFILTILIPAIILFLFLGDKILFLFGKEYSESALKLLRILTLSTFLLGITELYVVIKRVELEIRPVIRVYLLMTILTLIGCFGLIHRFGLTGVGIGWVLGYGIVALVTGISILRWLK